ncbi:3-hydroxyacyl-CoA dehydrogenase NAD-binding domain-containing protein [Spirillospora sp. NBC_00431]
MAVSYAMDDRGIVTLTMSQPDARVNMFDAEFGEALIAALDRLEADRDRVAGVILTSAATTFAVGADLDQIYAMTPGDAAAFTARIERAKTALRRLETLGRPVVAAINGSALGGGMELALACHRRVCAADPSILLGLPEVSLGVLPGGGGVVRTVWLLGPEAALPLLLKGGGLAPDAARAAGIVDEVVPPAELLSRAREWIAGAPRPVQPWDDPARRRPAAEPGFFAAATARLYAETRGNLPAPAKILACAAEAARTDFDTAMRAETAGLVELATGSQVAKNLIGSSWFQKREVARQVRASRTRVERIGVLGAGMMGAGIAHVSARAGIQVVLTDVSAEAARRGLAGIERLLDEQVARDRLAPEDRAAVLGRITADDPDLSGCDLVVEAVYEDRDLKHEVLAAAQAGARPTAVIASNTSTLPITGLAEGLPDPAAFVGAHFISPVERMPLVEIVKGARTSPGTVARAVAYARQIGKTPIVVNDGPGFYTSRVFIAYTTEGAAMLSEGVPAALIENIARKAGMPVGPLALSDDVSLATMLRVRRQSAGGTQPHDTIARMVDEFGRPGRQAGAGFYDHRPGYPKRLWPGLTEHFGGDRPIPHQDIHDRLLFAQALESVRAMEDGVVTSTAVANVGALLALGFAPWTGGTLQFINQYGPARFTARADQLADLYGEHLRPPSLLRAKAAQSTSF